MLDLSSNRVRIPLRVLDAVRRDLHRGIARLDPEAMERHGIMEGDLLLVEGEYETAVIAASSRDQDRGLGVIRLDPITRKNAGVNINDVVFVERVEKQYAQMVKLAPTNYFAPVEPSVIEEVKRRLIGRPLMEENEVHVVLMEMSIPFRVTTLKPKGPVIVSDETELYIFEEPVGEVPRITYE
ncbi:MAG: AAA family ATPase, partial [Thermosphaera sp.]